MRIYLASANLDAPSLLRLAGLSLSASGSDDRVVGQADHIQPLLKNIRRVDPDLLLLEWGLPFLAARAVRCHRFAHHHATQHQPYDAHRRHRRPRRDGGAGAKGGGKRLHHPDRFLAVVGP